jgi:ribosomal protein L20A (L18A)
MVKVEGPQKRKRRNWRQKEPRCAPRKQSRLGAWEKPLSLLGSRNQWKRGAIKRATCILIGRLLESPPQSRKALEAWV